MPAYKSHHYVPQTYMRLFSEDDARVGVFVVKTGRFIPQAPIGAQACRDYFYGKDPQVERAFGAIEGQAAKLLEDMVERRALPAPGSEDHERLVFFLGIQRCRTLAASDQHEEASVKAVKAMLSRQAELEGNRVILENLDRVRIRRTNAVSELVRYATVGSSLLADLRFALISNGTPVPFVASDAPVVLHNRLFEGQRINIIGFANVGLLLFLPLGPGLVLMAYDADAYEIVGAVDDVIALSEVADARLINDLQWEAAHAVILATPDTPKVELDIQRAKWTTLRKGERVLLREEIIEAADDQVRTRISSGETPSMIALDLSFIRPRMSAPPLLGPYDTPPVRDPARVARSDGAFAVLEAMDRRRAKVSGAV